MPTDSPSPAEPASVVPCPRCAVYPPRWLILFDTHGCRINARCPLCGQALLRLPPPPFDCPRALDALFRGVSA